MDEFIEFAETLAFINDLSETELLNEESLEALVEILHGVDFFPSSTDLIEAFGDLNLEDMDSWSAMDSDFLEALSVADEAHFLEGLDAEPLEVTSSFSFEQLEPVEMANFDFAATYTEAEAVTGRLNEALSSIPEPFQENIGGIDWTPLKNVEDPRMLGEWNQIKIGDLIQHETIKLYNEAIESVPTLFHEVGHSIASNYPNFYSQFISISSENPESWNFMGDLLKEYEVSKWGSEAFAESICYYKTQPDILMHQARPLYDLIDTWWTHFENQSST